MRLAAVLLCSIFTGCAGVPDAPTETLIPVPVPCLTTNDLPILPKLVTDAELLAMPDGDFVIALGLDRQERIRYMAVTEALLRACVK